MALWSDKFNQERNSKAMLYFIEGQVHIYVYKHVGEMEKDEKRSQTVSHVKLLK